jgi:chromate transporter
VPAPPLASVFRAWLILGVQSFGGGAATLTLIRRAAVDEHRWVTEDDFTRFWALCQMAPGTNLLGLTILIGRRVGGWRGVVVCLGGLLLPTVAVTVVMTAAYARVHDLAWMQPAVRGVIPATVGIGLVTAYQMAAPLVAASRREGRASLLFALGLLGASALLAALAHAPVPALLCGAGALSALVHAARDRARRGDEAR